MMEYIEEKDPAIKAEKTFSRLLHCAVRTSHIDLVRAIMNLGAEINDDEDELGRTLLMNASSKEMISFLIDVKAPLDGRNASGDTALMHAARICWRQPFKVLLEYRADPNLANNDGETALMLAAESPYSASTPSTLIRELISAKVFFECAG